jgi:pimeloyl-ACP methyl ester carboxylesterase
MKGLPLLLLHGYPFDHTLWERVIAHLDTQIKLIVPDLRGFGSNRPSGEPSLEAMASDVAASLPGPVVVAGFSMGGYVALALADRHPQLVAGIALINSQSAADTDEVRQGRRMMIEKVKEQGIRPATEAALPKLFLTQEPDLAHYALKGAEQAGAAGIAWGLEAMARRPDRTEVLHRLGKPLLIVHSPHDKFIPVTRARDLASSLNAKYIEIPDAGHCTPLEAPDKVAAALRQFINGH